MSEHRSDHRLLEELLNEFREEWKREKRILEHIEHRLDRIERKLGHKEPFTYRVTQENSTMITGIIPGQTGVFAATPLDAAGNPITTPLTVVPVWTSSDPLAVVTATADGLGASVAVDASAPQGGSFVLTVANPDGTTSVATTVPYDKVTPPSNVPASFAVNQVS